MRLDQDDAARIHSRVTSWMSTRPLAVFVVALCMATGACGGSSDSPTAPTIPPPVSGPACRTFGANVGPPFTPPILACGPVGSITANLIGELNGFWQSRVQACSCLSPQCQMNGVVFTQDPARIYYDAGLLSAWDQQYGTPLPSDIFVAHEMGHTVQLGLQLPVVHRELQADCLAGYFLGWRSCQGKAPQAEISQTFTNFCAIGTSSGANWFNPGVHGSCAQRVNAVQRGMNGYLTGQLPGQACPL